MSKTDLSLIIGIAFMVAMILMLIAAIKQTNRGLNEVRDIARIMFTRMTKDELRKLYKDSEYKAFKRFIEEELAIR